VFWRGWDLTKFVFFFCFGTPGRFLFPLLSILGIFLCFLFILFKNQWKLMVLVYVVACHNNLKTVIGNEFSTRKNYSQVPWNKSTKYSSNYPIISHFMRMAVMFSHHFLQACLFIRYILLHEFIITKSPIYLLTILQALICTWGMILIYSIILVFQLLSMWCSVSWLLDHYLKPIRGEF
jgi:hypothetical protein